MKNDIDKNGRSIQLENLETENLVVGGGLAGLEVAYELENRGHQVVLFEANKIIEGVSLCSTATITAEQGLIYFKLAKFYGYDFARLYYQSQVEAISNYESLIKQNNIDCDFKRVDDYFIELEELSEDFKNELMTLLKIGVPVHYVTEVPWSKLKIKGAIVFKNQAQFDVVKFLKGLKKDFPIFENERIIDIDIKRKVARTKERTIHYKNLILATHYPLLNKNKFLNFRLAQSSTYGMSFDSKVELKGIYNDSKEEGYTLRNYRDLLIIGGLDHHVGRKTTNVQDRILHFAYESDETLKPRNFFGNSDVISFDGLPYIGRYLKKKNIFIITAFNKFGMCHSLIASRLIADLIDGKKNPYEKLFSLSRKDIFYRFFPIIKNATLNMIRILKTYGTFSFRSYKKLKEGEGGVFLIHGKKTAVFKDSFSTFQFFQGTCPHMGCELVFNKELQLFECPCHGSTFTTDGTLKNNPANINLKRRKIKGQ